MPKLKAIIEYAKAVIKWLVSSKTLRDILYELSVTELIFGNKRFPDWVGNKKIIDRLIYVQSQIDYAMRLLDNKSTEDVVYHINNDKSGPFKDLVAKVVKDKYGAGNDGIDVGMDVKIGGKDVKIGYDLEDKKISIGPLSFDF